jgi:hypothetical protein
VGGSKHDGFPCSQVPACSFTDNKAMRNVFLDGKLAIQVGSAQRGMVAEHTIRWLVLPAKHRRKTTKRRITIDLCIMFEIQAGAIFRITHTVPRSNQERNVSPIPFIPESLYQVPNSSDALPTTADRRTSRRNRHSQRPLTSPKPET